MKQEKIKMNIPPNLKGDIIHGEHITIDPINRQVWLRYPNLTARYDMSQRTLAEWYDLMSRFHHGDNRSRNAKHFAEIPPLSFMEYVDEGKEAERVLLKSLMHHRDTTIGLWATDRPELFDAYPELKALLFEITYTEKQ